MDANITSIVVAVINLIGLAIAAWIARPKRR